MRKSLIQPSPCNRDKVFLPAVARGVFVLSDRKTANRRTHLVAEAQTVWRRGVYLYTEAAARCERKLVAASILTQAPDEFELCDDCVLSDYAVACVYRLFDAAGHLLYVGCTKDLAARFRSHAFGKKPSPWWPLVDHWTYDMYDDHAEALAAEAREIVTGQPLFNVDMTMRAKRPGRQSMAFMHLARTAIARRAFANST